MPNPLAHKTFIQGHGMSTEHNTDTVRAHYAELAASYDEKANPACKRAYETLVRRTLGDCKRVMELGAGSSPTLDVLETPFTVACDMSFPMLAARNAAPDAPRVAADGQQLPYADDAFDGVYSINVLEHVPDPAALAAEVARILEPGGLFLSITPNGDAEWLLDLLERLKLKLPEGPHKFLTFTDTAALAGDAFAVVEHRKFLAFPAGPEGLVKFIDGLGNGESGWGLFQYVLSQKK
jgi:SAM-dependent methyltransferase